MAERDLGLEDPVHLMKQAFEAGYEYGRYDAKTGEGDGWLREAAIGALFKVWVEDGYVVNERFVIQ